MSDIALGHPLRVAAVLRRVPQESRLRADHDFRRAAALPALFRLRSRPAHRKRSNFRASRSLTARSCFGDRRRRRFSFRDSSTRPTAASSGCTTRRIFKAMAYHADDLSEVLWGELLWDA